MYRKSNGRDLENPEKWVDPKFGYVLGRAAGVSPYVMGTLSPEGQAEMSGWNTSSGNVFPGLAEDAVAIHNQLNGYTDIENPYEGIKYPDYKLKLSRES